MKATTLLERQHRKVEQLFKKLEGGRSDKAKVLEELSNDLAAHMAIEQEIFYPAVLKLNEELVCESYEEHSMAELAMKRLRNTSEDDEAFDARVKVAKELIEQHVDEEEEDLFPSVDDKMDDDEHEQLGARMKARYEQILSKGFDQLVPPSMEQTSADIALENFPEDEGEDEEEDEKEVARRRGRRPRYGL